MQSGPVADCESLRRVRGSAAVMSDDSSPEDGGNEAVAILVDWLRAPGRAFSSLIFGLGVWGLILGIVNITMGAVIAGERKVVWAGWISMGYFWDQPYADFNGVSESFQSSDLVFMLLASAGICWGTWGLHQKVDGGFPVWVKGILLNPIWTSLVSGTEKGGTTMTAAAWCLFLGFAFYVYWALVHWAWVDIGVYAVAAPLIGFGFGLRYLALVEDGEPSTKA